MTSGASRSPAASTPSPPQRSALRTPLVVGAVIVGVVVVGGLVRGSGAGSDDAAPGRDSSGPRAASPTEPAPAPRPALPQGKPAEPALPQDQPTEPARGGPHATGVGAAAANRKFTEIKVEKYVHEAYPAWRRAHPGEQCPHRLSELNEYMDDKDANDGWGRPLKMYCGAERWAGSKMIEVISIGRDAQIGTEDDIKAEE